MTTSARTQSSYMIKVFDPKETPPSCPLVNYLGCGKCLHFRSVPHPTYKSACITSGVVSESRPCILFKPDPREMAAAFKLPSLVRSLALATLHLDDETLNMLSAYLRYITAQKAESKSLKKRGHVAPLQQVAFIFDGDGSYLSDWRVGTVIYTSQGRATISFFDHLHPDHAKRQFPAIMTLDEGRAYTAPRHIRSLPKYRPNYKAIYQAKPPGALRDAVARAKELLDEKLASFTRVLEDPSETSPRDDKPS